MYLGPYGGPRGGGVVSDERGTPAGSRVKMSGLRVKSSGCEVNRTVLSLPLATVERVRHMSDSQEQILAPTADTRAVEQARHT